MTEEEKINAFDLVTALHAQVKGLKTQSDQFLQILQQIAGIVGATEETQLQELVDLVKDKVLQETVV